MIKSRTAPWLLVVLVPLPAAAQTVPAEELVEAQRSQLRQGIRSHCPPTSGEEEIVVCGQRDQDRDRLPLPPGPDPSLPANRAGGEQRAALAIDTSRCTTVGPNQQCNQGLDVIGIAFTVARAVAQALINRER